MKIPNDLSYVSRFIMHSYQEFLKTTIYSKDKTVAATFKEENGKVFIVTPQFEIQFKMLYKEELHSVLLIAAEQLLNIKVEEYRAHEEALKIVEQLKQKQKNDDKPDDLGDQEL